MCRTKDAALANLDENRKMRDRITRSLVEVIEAQKKTPVGSREWTRLELLFASLIREDDALRLEMTKIVEAFVKMQAADECGTSN